MHNRVLYPIAMRQWQRFAAVLTGLIALAASAAGDVVRIPEGAFTPAAGLITFSEVSLGTHNPVYTPAMYGGGAGAPVVSFDGFFVGQALGTAATCPAGAALSGCVVGNPTGPLTLSAASPDTYTSNDGANPTSPVLSGTPIFNGPISMLFSTDVAGVGLQGGYFNAIGGTAIRAYDRAGLLLGQVSNVGLGIEFLGLVTDDGQNRIAGLQFSLVGSEPAGFAIDNVRFGTADQVVIPGVPEPMSVVLLGTVLVGLVLSRRMSAGRCS